MNLDTNNDAVVVISLKDLRALIADRTKKARIEELENMRPLGNVSFINSRISALKGGKKTTVLRGVRKADRSNSISLHSVRFESLPEEVRQYLVR